MFYAGLLIRTKLNMKYTVVNFSSADIQEWQKDLLISELGGMAFDSFEETDDGFKAYIPTEQLDVLALESLLLKTVEGYTIDYSIEDIPYQNWNEIWESNFKPIVVDERCYVRATFHPSDPNYPIELVIEPKMAFGTGHHQTTSMMISFLLDNDVENKSVLDMGCGTGILAILASKKGASNILAVDNDEVCIENVRDNMKLNEVKNIQCEVGSVEKIEEKEFDIIYANINRNILLDHMPMYANSLPLGGELYLSGFYDGEDLQLLQKAANKYNLEFLDKKTTDNWCAARFTKR